VITENVNQKADMYENAMIWHIWAKYKSDESLPMQY